MRRDEYPIKGGSPGLILVSETDEDRRLTAVERMTVETAIRGICPPIAPVWKQLDAARVRDRELTGYGAYIHLEPFNSSVELDPRLIESGFGESFIKAPWRGEPLSCILFLEMVGSQRRHGYLGTLEFFPSDGEHWCVGEMEQLLFGPVNGVQIASTPDAREDRH